MYLPNAPVDANYLNCTVKNESDRNIIFANRSYSPAARSPRRRSVSPAPARGRSYSRSPQYNRAREASPYDNG